MGAEAEKLRKTEFKNGQFREPELGKDNLEHCIHTIEKSERKNGI